MVEFRRAFWLTDEETGRYNVLWLDIASRRAGGGGTAILDELLAQADDPGRWPVPLLRMFRSRLTAQQAVASASATDPRKSLLQKCEAWFYAGQLYLIGGERDQAKAAFEAAVATGAVEYLEYDWALRELELLGIAP